MWSYSSCQVQGRGHSKNQIPCQDKTKAIFENGTYVISLADGAGSAKLSHYGAACIVESISALFEYSPAAEPPVRCGESHHSGLTEPPVTFNYCI